jgi:LEA14-like dessication related protein
MSRCRTAFLLAVSLLSPLSAACSSASLKKPTAEFRSANVRDVTAEGFTVDFNVDLDNPNAVALPLAEADYELALAGVRVAEGDAKPDEATIPANGSRSVTLPVRVKLEDLLNAGDALSRGGTTVPYDFKGGLDFGGGRSMLGMNVPMRVPLTYSGELDLSEVLASPDALLRGKAGRAIEGLLKRGRGSGN